MCVLSVAVISSAVVYVLTNTHEVIPIEAPSPVPSTPPMPLPSGPITVVGMALSFLIQSQLSPAIYKPIQTPTREIYQKMQDGPCRSLSSIFGCFPLTIH